MPAIGIENSVYAVGCGFGLKPACSIVALSMRFWRSRRPSALWNAAEPFFCSIIQQLDTAPYLLFSTSC